jgi:hypothetical protein
MWKEDKRLFSTRLRHLLNACPFCSGLASSYRPLLPVFYHAHELTENTIVRLVEFIRLAL